MSEHYQIKQGSMHKNISHDSDAGEAQQFFFPLPVHSRRSLKLPAISVNSSLTSQSAAG